MNESDEIPVSLTKAEVDLVLNLLHNRTRPKTVLAFDLETKLLQALGNNVDDRFGRPEDYDAMAKELQCEAESQGYKLPLDEAQSLVRLWGATAIDQVRSWKEERRHD